MDWQFDFCAVALSPAVVLQMQNPSLWECCCSGLKWSPIPRAKEKLQGTTCKLAYLNLSQGVTWITLPWQPFKQHVPNLPFSPVLHIQGPGGISALVELQAPCSCQLCKAAQWPCAFQRALTATYPIVLHKSNFFFFFFLKTARHNYHSIFLAICLLQRCSAVFSFAEPGPSWIWGLLCPGSRQKQPKRNTFMYQGWYHCEKCFPL